PDPDVLPRIWWCATGPLAFLPIHAAGIYGPESGDSQLISYPSSNPQHLEHLLFPIPNVNWTLSDNASPVATISCSKARQPDEPTKSALLLQDGHLTLEEIIKLELPRAEFAFLSACQTTAGDENLSEEALAPVVTDEFYRHIMKEGDRPDPRKAAEALHMAIQK
ncbi:11925_t:CDS:2, partial [Acaulospora colombiana]